MAVEQRVLIYFDELIMALAKTYAETMDTHIYSPRDILSSIQGLHHVDAVEVVHGWWIEVETEEEFGWITEQRCSKCGMYAYDATNYCPHCGANMRGSEE